MAPPSIMLSQVALVARTTAWLAGTLWRASRWRAVAVIALNVLGVLMRTTSIALLLFFIHAQTTDEPLLVGGVEIPTEPTPPILAGWALAVLLTALLTALATYGGEVVGFRVADLGVQRLTRRGLTVLARARREPVPALEKSDGATTARRMLLGDMTMLTRASIMLQRLVTPSLQLAVAAAVLVVLEPVLTLVAAAALAAYLLPFAQLGRSVVRASRDYEQHRSERSALAGDVLDFTLHGPEPIVTGPDWPDAYVDHPTTRASTELLRRILLARRRVMLLQDVFLGVVLAAMLVAFASLVGEGAWTRLLTYVVAFRYAVAGMSRVASLVTGLNRFHPQMRRVKELLETSAPPRAVDEADPAPADDAVAVRLRAKSPSLPDSKRSLDLRRGDRALCVDCDPLDSLRLNRLARRLAGPAGDPRLPDRVGYLGTAAAPPLRLPLEGEGAPEADASPSDRRLELLDAALAEDRPVLVLPWRWFDGLTEEDRDRALRRLDGRTLILHADRAPTSPPDWVNAVVVLGPEGVAGLGDATWYAGLDRSTLSACGFDPGSGRGVDASDRDDFDEDDDL